MDIAVEPVPLPRRPALVDGMLHQKGAMCECPVSLCGQMRAVRVRGHTRTSGLRGPFQHHLSDPSAGPLFPATLPRVLPTYAWSACEDCKQPSISNPLSLDLPSHVDT